MLARSGAVHGVRVEEGALAARVVGSDGDEHEASVAARPVPPRVWAAIARAGRADDRLRPAVEGRAQSTHLAHQMAVDWEEPLVPDRRDLDRACSCGHAPGCEHLAAAAYVARGRDRPRPVAPARAGAAASTGPRSDPVPEPPPERRRRDGGSLGAPDRCPELQPPRPLPVGAVLKRLGPSGMRAGGEDLADVLQRAYAAFARPTR